MSELLTNSVAVPPSTPTYTTDFNEVSKFNRYTNENTSGEMTVEDLGKMVNAARSIETSGNGQQSK